MNITVVINMAISFVILCAVVNSAMYGKRSPFFLLVTSILFGMIFMGSTARVFYSLGMNLETAITMLRVGTGAITLFVVIMANTRSKRGVQ